jgi:hypothetical protein
MRDLARQFSVPIDSLGKRNERRSDERKKLGKSVAGKERLWKLKKGGVAF